MLFHLENPQEAQRLQTAIAAGGLAALIADDIRANEATAKRFRRKDAARRRPRWMNHSGYLTVQHSRVCGRSAQGREGAAEGRQEPL